MIVCGGIVATPRMPRGSSAVDRPRGIACEWIVRTGRLGRLRRDGRALVALGPLLEAYERRHLLYVLDVVDNVAAQSCGPALQVANQLGLGAASLLRSFQAFKLPVEHGKCAYLCAREVGARFRELWALPTFCRPGTIRNL